MMWNVVTFFSDIHISVTVSGTTGILFDGNEEVQRTENTGRVCEGVGDFMFKDVSYLNQQENLCTY